MEKFIIVSIILFVVSLVTDVLFAMHFSYSTDESSTSTLDEPLDAALDFDLECPFEEFEPPQNILDAELPILLDDLWLLILFMSGSQLDLCNCRNVSRRWNASISMYTRKYLPNHKFIVTEIICKYLGYQSSPKVVAAQDTAAPQGEVPKCEKSSKKSQTYMSFRYAVFYEWINVLKYLQNVKMKNSLTTSKCHKFSLEELENSVRILTDCVNEYEVRLHERRKKFLGESSYSPPPFLDALLNNSRLSSSSYELSKIFKLQLRQWKPQDINTSSFIDELWPMIYYLQRISVVMEISELITFLQAISQEATKIPKSHLASVGLRSE